MGDDYREDLKIDKLALDEECAEHARLYEQWSKVYSNAQEQEAYDERAVTVLRAQKRLDILRDPEKYGLPKPKSGTNLKDGDIKAIIESDNEIDKAERRVIKAKKTTALLRGAKESFEQRKWLLGDMVKLWINSYWADPHTGGDAREKIQERQEMVMSNILDKNKRLKRLQQPKT